MRQACRQVGNGGAGAALEVPSFGTGHSLFWQGWLAVGRGTLRRAAPSSSSPRSPPPPSGPISGVCPLNSPQITTALLTEKIRCKCLHVFICITRLKIQVAVPRSESMSNRNRYHYSVIFTNPSPRASFQVLLLVMAQSFPLRTAGRRLGPYQPPHSRSQTAYSGIPELVPLPRPLLLLLRRLASVRRRVEASPLRGGVEVG